MELGAEPNCLLPAGFHDADGGIVFFSSGDVGLQAWLLRGGNFSRRVLAHSFARPAALTIHTDRKKLIAPSLLLDGPVETTGPDVERQLAEELAAGSVGPNGRPDTEIV